MSELAVSRAEVQRAHDLLSRVIFDDAIHLPTGMGARVVNWFSVLCWLLGTETPATNFGEWLKRIEALVREVDILVRSVEEVMMDTVISAARVHRVLAAMAIEQNPEADLDERMWRMATILREPAQYDELWRRVKQCPRIVCLCGSTRFWKDYAQLNQRETLAGNIVLTVGFFVHPEPEPSGTNVPYMQVNAEMKARLDELHLRKIDLADEVYIINRGGYIGDSTRAELTYAREHGKPVRSLEPLEEAANVPA